MEGSESQNAAKTDENVDKNAENNNQTNENQPQASDRSDPELDDLLDSALEDFDKPPPGAANSNVSASKTDDSSTATGTSSKGDTSGKGDTPGATGIAGPSLPPDQEAMFNEIFRSEIADEATKHFEEAMKALMTEDPNMYDQLNKLSQAADNVGDNNDTQKEFFGTLQETLGSLAVNAQDLQGDLNEEDLARAMSSLGLDVGAEGQGQEDFVPMMQTMMKSLLSKEILYPSLKEISEKYPTWLENNKDTVESDQYDKYSEQYRIMKTICAELEQETSNDDDDIKRQRFEKILGLMQQMQECGQPPPDIVGEMAPGLEFDENGIPKLPGAPEQCTVM